MTLKDLIVHCDEMDKVQITEQTNEWDEEHQGGFEVKTLKFDSIDNLVIDLFDEMNCTGKLDEKSIYNRKVYWYKITKDFVLYIRLY